MCLCVRACDCASSQLSPVTHVSLCVKADTRLSPGSVSEQHQRSASLYCSLTRRCDEEPWGGAGGLDPPGLQARCRRRGLNLEPDLLNGSPPGPPCVRGADGSRSSGPCPCVQQGKASVGPQHQICQRKRLEGGLDQKADPQTSWGRALRWSF